MSLKTDYKDAVYTGKRKYRITGNSDGTSGIEDATEYEQEGTRFGAKDINDTNEAINNHLSDTENPHKVTAEQAGAAKKEHEHAVSDISDFPQEMTPSAHTQSANTITAGTFSNTGVKAATGTDYTTQRIRNIAAQTGAVTAGTTSLANGNVLFQYS